MAGSTTELQCLKTNWGHDRFRPDQQEVIQASLSGRDTFVLMSTGSGKSICYQLPAVLRRRHGRGPVTVVVSPLISLMEDQVLSLRSNGIPACFLGSGVSDLGIERKAEGGEFSLVFVTPEKIAYWDHGLQAIRNGPGLALFAVDESHCVAEWGHDFRPSYLELSCLRKKYPEVPIMALTATATPRVEREIIANLGLRDPFVAKTSFNRSNLHYTVKVQGADKQVELRRLLTGLNGSAIVYVMTKKEAEDVASQVSQIVGSRGARGYHGGMSYTDRREVHHAFLRDEIQVVVATLAFGMGIDKPDVRLVVHCGLAKTLESYYQQTGRAGRDGLPASCVLLFSRGDVVRQKAIMSMPTAGGSPPLPAKLVHDTALLAEMEKYATTAACRRRTLLQYFGEEFENGKRCEGCDNCDRASAIASRGGNTSSSEDVDLYSDLTRLLLQAVQDSGQRFGLLVPISLLMGTKKCKDKVYNATKKTSFAKGKGNGHSEAFWKALFHQLVERERLLEAVSLSGMNGMGRTTYKLTRNGETFLRNALAKLPASFVPSEELHAEGEKMKHSREVAARRLRCQTEVQARAVPSNQGCVPGRGTGIGLEGAEKKMYDRLHTLRSEIAVRHGIPPYNVLGVPVLRQLSVQRPTDLPALHTVDGISEKKIQDYGEEIVKVIAMGCSEYDLSPNVPKIVADPSSEMWMTTMRDTKPVTDVQIALYNKYMQNGSMTLTQVAASMHRPISLGTAVGHMVACLDGGRPFPFDRQRLGVDPDIEKQVLGVVDNFKASGLGPLATGFRLKPIFDELPPGTDSNAYNTIKLLLARLRYESKGNSLPQVDRVCPQPPAKPSLGTDNVRGKKRPLPWAPTAPNSINKQCFPPHIYGTGAGRWGLSSRMATGSGGLQGGAVVIVAPKAELFLPSYKDRQEGGQKNEKDEKDEVTSLVTEAKEGDLVVSPVGSGDATPSLKTQSQTQEKIGKESKESKEVLSAESLFKQIQETGGDGLALQDMLKIWPGSSDMISKLLEDMLSDFMLYTKTGEARSGCPEVYVSL